MATVLPPGPNPTIEPVKLPCSSPPECAAAKKMVADNRWLEWHYIGTRTAPGSTGTVEIAGYTHEYLLAYNAMLPGSWPPPPFYPFLSSQKPANAVTVISSPPPAD